MSGRFGNAITGAIAAIAGAIVGAFAGYHLTSEIEKQKQIQELRVNSYIEVIKAFSDYNTQLAGMRTMDADNCSERKKLPRPTDSNIPNEGDLTAHSAFTSDVQIRLNSTWSRLLGARIGILIYGSTAVVEKTAEFFRAYDELYICSSKEEEKTVVTAFLKVIETMRADSPHVSGKFKNKDICLLAFDYDEC